ncbi:hypothetical protein GGR13_002226 [Brevundimonas variabilis]|uniref:Uncharacterized protein n=1 Tax=Brevundimonas variabilis TaxID=74312 RepID=A0A7W9FER4_9CAUL|nr:hypothetical protein [Brevundimonas variabilis]
MLVVALVAFVLQQTSGGVVWDPQPDLRPDAEPPRAAAPTLPDWAIADPFAWERSQCSSLVRGAVSLGACQARVRTELAANLGDALPPALKPTGLEGECLPTDNAATGFAVSCAPQRRERAVVFAPRSACVKTVPSAPAKVWSPGSRPAALQAGRLIPVKVSNCSCSDATDVSQASNERRRPENRTASGCLIANRNQDLRSDFTSPTFF